MKLSHRTLLSLAALLWLVVGAILLPMGVGFLMDGVLTPQLVRDGSYPLLQAISPYSGGVESSVILLIAASLLIGSIKARRVFSKVVKKSVIKVSSLPNPAKVTAFFDRKYLILVGSMILLGISLRYFAVPKDIRGFINVAVGAALINGSSAYFKEVLRLKSCNIDSCS